MLFLTGFVVWASASNDKQPLNHHKVPPSAPHTQAHTLPIAESGIPGIFVQIVWVGVFVSGVVADMKLGIRIMLWPAADRCRGKENVGPPFLKWTIQISLNTEANLIHSRHIMASLGECKVAARLPCHLYGFCCTSPVAAAFGKPVCD